MKKSIIAFALAAVLLCGCANTEENPPIAEDTSTEQTTAAQRKVPEEYGNSPEFTGILFDEEAMPCPSINNKLGYPQMFCFHDETVYFVNPQDGRRLYSFDGKETKRLTEVPAMSLYYRDGEIYFLSARTDYSYDSQIDVKGRLYKYRVESGETIQLSDTVMKNLLVDENGIYYSVSEPRGDGISAVTYYEFDEESGSAEMVCDVNFFQRFGEIELIFGPARSPEETSGVTIFLKKGEEVYRLLTGVIPAQYGIWDGKFYYIDQDTRELFSIDLTNGEKESFGRASDYTVVNGEVYTNHGGLCKKEAGGDVEIGDFPDEISFEYSENEQEWNGNIHYWHLYTTGTEMYALITGYYDGQAFNEFARVSVGEDGYTLLEVLS